MSEALEEYLTKLRQGVDRFSSHVASSSILHETRHTDRHIIKGRILFVNGARLDFLEFILVISEGLERLAYRFNLSDRGGELVIRYDNAPITLSWRISHTTNTPQR